ncbi:prolyl aminopeptidase [Ectothiorhodospira lacustris]|uniref:prolyl aminopeptidase n=1 Tax=Ectothiorhodospira lacustris TaxID=2899127 RepID=UPI001EE92825|nr:prolyl aminopeptidase [Ectothiorhodospira lacustris]MCG5500717.1 prolyl aminopeptidase [Ectothiorhodospira lacustris]MCG5509064.1 prolyl aminopeptidase [Ectothiorhodospira lacustris]MCG5520855.1 prolyl aminopeptidase [Ectothiorhodospira lacustris]
MSAAPLFPDIRPYRSHHLDVDPPHRLYLEECGIAGGLPVVFLHGGPGSGCESWHRRFFDPNRYRIVLFDQRGCGRSVPHAGLEGNTTWDLVADMERIREYLGIDRWVLFGGSWGSTLALAYAQTHPERVLGMVLRGIFLCRDEDIQWFYQEGAGRLFPDYWADYLAPIPETERGDMVAAYYRRLTGADEVARMAAAKAWSEWEGRTATLMTNPAVVGHFQNPFTALSLARIECHYFRHQAFMVPGQLLRDAHRLKDIPGYIIHGRYDVVCPVDQAWTLHRAWPQAELTIVPDAGHSAGEPGIARALVAATQALADRLA